MLPLYLDIGFVVVVIISLAVGAGRGFARSLLSVVSWVVSIWVTWQYAEVISRFLEPLGVGPGLQRPAAYIGLFFLTLLIMSIISMLISRSLISEGAISIDRTLGAAFGVVRGVVIVLVLIIVGTLTVYVDEHWWQKSIAVNWLEPWANSIRDWLSDMLSTQSPSA